MSGRPQARGRQPRRERSQRSRGRDNSADSVSSTRSERDPNRNGRNTRRRPERRDERPRKADDKTAERDNIRNSTTEKRDDKVVDRHGNTSNDSRLTSLIKRVSRETDRERRLAAAKQLEEFFCNVENIQLILKNADSVLSSLEDILYERGLSDIKEHVIQCLTVFANLLGYDTRRFFQWMFGKLDSSASDEIKTILLTALPKIIQYEGSRQCFAEIVVNVISLLQNILENVDSPDLLYAVLNVIMPIATDFPQAFAGYFRDTVDILVGWHIDTSQQESLTRHTSDCLIKLHPYWASDIAFSLTLLGQFLEDMEAYAEELSMDLVSSPYTSLPKLTALIRVLTTVVNGIGEFFSPAQTPAITVPYINDIVQRVIQCISLSGFTFYYEQLFIVGNHCLGSMCSYLQMYYAGCCEQTGVFITQQLLLCPSPTFNHTKSLLQLTEQIITRVGTSIPKPFVHHIMHSDSPVMKLRLTHDETILSMVMKAYQGFLGIKDIQLMEEAYSLTVCEITEQFKNLKQITDTANDTDELPNEELPTNEATETPNDPNSEMTVTTETKNEPMVVDSVAQLPSQSWSVGDDTAEKVEKMVENKRHKAHEIQTILIFDLCSLSEIATAKSAIIGLWKLTPSLFELLTTHVSACEWNVASCFPAVQYTVLHSLYSHCQRNTHFLSSVKDLTRNTTSQTGSMSFILNLLSKLLVNSSTAQDSRRLCLVWVMEILDLIFKSGPEITSRVQRHFNFDILAKSLLPLTFSCCHLLTMEVCQCLKILIEMKLLSPVVLKRCLQDCTVRLMDVNEDVQEAYMSLVKALPTDIITSFASRNLLQDRVKLGKTSNDCKQLAISSEDVWWTKKSHMMKSPTGTFHSYNFQVIMTFIQHGILPSKEMQKDWLVRLFHTCNRTNKYSEKELAQFNNSQSVLWFWSTWETAQFCILSKLRTSLGRAQETFQAIEASINQCAKEAKAADIDDQAKPRNKEDKKTPDEERDVTAPPKAFISQMRTTLLLQFVENLEKLMYNAHDGCTVGLPSPPKSVRVFFRTNRSTCQEWLSRIRLPAMEVSLRCGDPALAVWHGMQVLQEMKANGKLKGPEFELSVLLTCKALCAVKSPQAIQGIKAWYTKHTDQELSWIDGLIHKAKGWYERSAEEYKKALKKSLPIPNGQSVNEDKFTNTSNELSPATVDFLVNEVSDCYTKLADWNEVEKWQKDITNARKLTQDTDVQRVMHLNTDMNYIKALSRFEESNFEASQDHLRLIPGNSLNAMADSVRKSSWSIVPKETEVTFTPLWDLDKIYMAADLCLIQAGVLYALSGGTATKNNIKDGKVIQAVKECIQQCSSLSSGALRVGCLDWPPLVTPEIILQVQQASIMENIIDAFSKGNFLPSILQGDGSFSADSTRHNCAVLNQAIRFTTHISHLSSIHGKPRGSLNSELSTLQLETAKLARKQENFTLAQKLLMKQLIKLGVVVQPDSELNGQNTLLGSLVHGLTSVSNIKGSCRLDLLKAQRESAKLAHTLDHTHDAVGILSSSVLEFAKANESDETVRELNSRSLVTLAKWLMNDRKLLTSATKTSSNVTPLVAKISSLCDTEEEFLGYGRSTLISSPGEQEMTNFTLNDEMVWSGGCNSIGSGVDDVESVCGQLFHLSIMQTPSLGKAWYYLAGWCYRWGRKTVEQASSMGSVELLLEERDKALQSMPKGASEEEIDSVLSELGQAHSTSLAYDEDIGDDDQFCDNGMDITKKLLLQACPSLEDADPSCLETLLSIWKGVRDRLFKHYHYAAKAYFMYLKIGNGYPSNDKTSTATEQPKKINKSSDDGNVTATLRLLRLLVKHAGELRSVLEEGLAGTPTRPWKDIIPQLFSRLNHPENYVRQSVTELLCRVARDAPHLIVYPAVVGCTSSMPQFLNKTKENEGLIPLLVASIQDKKSNSENSSQPSSATTGTSSDKQSKQDNDGSLDSCYKTIVDSLQTTNPTLVTQLQQFIQELRRITLLWEELWLGSLIQTHQDVLRRQQQLDEEIKRVSTNVTLSEQQKMTLIKEKHIAIMKPVVFALEQLQKITNHPPATPHEQWFHKTYKSIIENALDKLRNPDNSSDPKASWEPFKQLVQTLQSRSQKKSAYSLIMSAISPVLCKMRNTAIYMPGQTHFGGEIVTLHSISNDVNILPTKTKPKKLVFIGSDGQRHTYLFKGLEDLHLDERIMQFLAICNNMFTRADSHRCPLFNARHYSVTPLGPRSGLIQWVDGAVPLFALYKRWQQREAITASLIKTTQGNNPTPPPPMKPSELFYSKMTPALKEKGIKETDRKDWPLTVMRSVLEELIKETPTDLLARELWCSCTGSLEWWHITKTYARSTAVMSMIGYIIGLGDRHLDNMLVDFTTGEVVHIDYNVCFEKGKGLRVPEKVPFRLTPNLEMALGVTGVEGMFRLSCEQVLKVLRQGRETLLTLLEAFVYDPLVDWTTAGDNAFASAFYGGGTAAINDSKNNKKEMERGVTQSLFSSRVAEMKVTWTANRDEMLSCVSVQDDHVNEYVSCVKHLQSMDHTLEKLKEQQATLQSAVNNTSHPLHSLQAKFDEHVKQKSNHDSVLQSIKGKLTECINWHSQHKMSMEMIHSQQFSILVSEIIKPLDVGVPCFAPAIKFLKGAGQGNIVSQCEQLESELVTLLQQRRNVQRQCLDLIHTYATVTSSFPPNYVTRNRTYEWMYWLRELMQHPSKRMCQDVLKKSDDTRVEPDKADNPLSVADMNSLMSMEVRLKSNLTEQNSKFIKYCERRKQESVETGYLSKAVDESLTNLNNYIKEHQSSTVYSLSCVLIKTLCTQTKRCLVMENTAKVACDRLSEVTSRDGDWFLEELCSLSGNVYQILSLLKEHPLVLVGNKVSVTEEASNGIHAVSCVHKVFTALQELMANFRNIIVPEAIKSLTSKDQSVLSMIDCMDDLVNGDESLSSLITSIDSELHGNTDLQSDDAITLDAKISVLRQAFDAIQQSRTGLSKEGCMSAGQMLLAGFNGLFTKVECEIDAMASVMSRVNANSTGHTSDVVKDAKKLQGDNMSSQLCSKLFFLKKLIVMTAFFKDCRLLVENIQAQENPNNIPNVNHSPVNSDNQSSNQSHFAWNADMCFSEDDLAQHIRQFIAESVQKRILGFPSHAMGTVVETYVRLMGKEDDGKGEEDIECIEKACKKVVEVKVKKGVFSNKVLSQMNSLTSAYDIAWRKHDFARRLDHNISLYKGIVQRAQLQLARFQWLYEDELLRCPLRGNSMISPAKANIMSDMKKRVQALVQLEPTVKALEEKIVSQQSSIEQRLKWAAGANPGLNPVLKEFDKTVDDRKQVLQVEAKHSSDICSLSNALIHFEMMRTHSNDVTALDNTLTALVKKCYESCSEFEKSMDKLRSVSEITSLLHIACPPDCAITLTWMKTKLDTVTQEISSHKSRKSQAASAVATKRDSLKNHTNALKTLIVTHQQLVSEVKALLTTMAKDEDAQESSSAAKLFISSYNRLSDDCAQLIKTTLNACSSKIDSNNKNSEKNNAFHDNIQEIKALTESVISLVQWVHDHLLSLASPLVPDDPGTNGGKTPIAAPPPTFASALQKGNTGGEGSKETSEMQSSLVHNPVLVQKEHGLHSPAGGASPRTNPAAVASPKRSTSSLIARDPKTGKALQQRNTYAISVWRKVKAKLDGRDVDQTKRMSVTDQVDHVIREATSLDNLSQMYEGWTAWV